VEGSAFDDTAAATVAQLQHLQRLEWSDGHYLSDGGLLQLAELTNLRRIRMWNCRDLSHAILAQPSSSPACPHGAAARMAPDKDYLTTSQLVLETAEVSSSCVMQHKLLVPNSM
jgi:aspartate 1-decarboxylase